MVTVPRDADLGTFIDNHQGETIDVPDATYAETNINIGTNTTVNFNWTTIDPGVGNTNLITTSGTGWHVGGDCRIIQSWDAWVRFTLQGAGQFGDTSGRIVIDGYGHRLEAEQTRSLPAQDHMFTFDGSSSGEITIVNVSHPGERPGSDVGYHALSLADRPGPIEFWGCDIRQTSDNGLYSSIDTTVTARHCYFKNLQVGTFRTRADQGTTMADCNVVYDESLGTQDGGGRYGSAICSTHYGEGAGLYHLKNTHFHNTGPAQFVRNVQGGGDLRIEDCQWTGHPGGIDSGFNITYVGTNGASPVDNEGPYPFTPSTPSYTTDDVWLQNAENHVVITSDVNGATYTIEVDGTVTGGADAEPGVSDALTDNGDGTYTIDGSMDDHTDDWYITGTVTSATFHGSMELHVNGHAFPAGDLAGTGGTVAAPSVSETAALAATVTPSAAETVTTPPPDQRQHTIEIVAHDGAPQFDYTFTTTGKAQKVTDVGDRSAEADDSVTENSDGTWTVSGQVTGGFGDTFGFDGDVTAWGDSTIEENFTIYLDGKAVTVAELLGEEEGGTGGPVETEPPQSDDGIRVRLQKNANGQPEAPDNRKKDIARRTVSGESLEDGGWTRFLLPDNDTPSATPWIIIEADGDVGQEIGIDTTTGEPGYRIYYSYPVNVALPDPESQTRYRRREGRVKDDAIDTFEAAESLAQTRLRDTADPTKTLTVEAVSERMHQLTPGDIVTLDEPAVEAVGKFVVTERSDDYEGNQLNTTLSIRSLPESFARSVQDAPTPTADEGARALFGYSSYGESSYGGE